MSATYICPLGIIMGQKHMHIQFIFVSFMLPGGLLKDPLCSWHCLWVGGIVREQFHPSLMWLLATSLQSHLLLWIGCLQDGCSTNDAQLFFLWPLPCCYSRKYLPCLATKCSSLGLQAHSEHTFSSKAQACQAKDHSSLSSPQSCHHSSGVVTTGLLESMKVVHGEPQVIQMLIHSQQ